MLRPPHLILLPACCLLCSAVGHLLCLLALNLTATYHFAAPVPPAAAVLVDLASFDGRAAPAAPASPSLTRVNEMTEAPAAGAAKMAQVSPAASGSDALAPGEAGGREPLEPAPREASREPARESFREEPVVAAARPEPSKEEPVSPEAGQAQQAAQVQEPPETVPREVSALRRSRRMAARMQAPRLKGSDFLAAQHEKLTYRISMHGIPIGDAELEARNDGAGFCITLRVRSNAVVSGIFPVDDLVETRHVDGQFIMTRIRQQEGSFRSDETFTINLPKKRVSSVNFLDHKSLVLKVPTDQVLDSLSGIYLLRNRRLEVGRTETLHIYDSESYAEVPVEVLRGEEIRLANLAPVRALVLRPQQKTAGIFRRTGEVLIWMTDDENRVPVRIVTTVALGQVTAELVAAESTRSGEPEPRAEQSALLGAAAVAPAAAQAVVPPPAVPYHPAP